MDRYEVIMLADSTKTRWSMMFSAEDFAHAEEQALDTMHENGDNDLIVQINRDYE